MHTIAHSEYTAYEHHITGLAARGKTLNRFDYKGQTVIQKADGFYVGEIRLRSYELSKFFIDRAIEAMPLEEVFEYFRKRFYLSKVTVYSNCMVYRTSVDKAKVCAADANKLIAELGLPLRAQATTFHMQDSFVVQKAGLRA
jgi:hypothetical protein